MISRSIANGIPISNGSYGNVCLRCWGRRVGVQPQFRASQTFSDSAFSSVQTRAVSVLKGKKGRHGAKKQSKKQNQEAEAESFLFYSSVGSKPPSVNDRLTSQDRRPSSSKPKNSSRRKRKAPPETKAPSSNQQISSSKKRDQSEEDAADMSVFSNSNNEQKRGGRRRRKSSSPEVKNSPSFQSAFPFRKALARARIEGKIRRVNNDVKFVMSKVPWQPIIKTVASAPELLRTFISQSNQSNEKGQTLRHHFHQGTLKHALSRSSEKASDEPVILAHSEDQIPKLTSGEVGIEINKELAASDVQFDAIDSKVPPVPRLAHGLDRVLFNRGVYQFRDLHSRVYNFDPSLEMITPSHEIDFNSLKGFTSSANDSTLASMALSHGKKYIGSTSSMTGTLKHLHFLLSKFRALNMDMFSMTVTETLPSKHTNITMAPESIFLRWKDGIYAIDQDKEFGFSNVLSYMGRYMEKLLTVDMETFARHKKGQSNPITEGELDEDLSHHYSSIGDMLMRSQLDAYDPRLPGTGTFDIKTRAVIPVRMDSKDPAPLLGYEVTDTRGLWGSYEREYADLVRSTLLKYSLQARIGRMDGIFIAYHNIIRLFGFQYMSLDEMDQALHGEQDRTLGDCEFRFSVHLLNKILNEATAKFPEQSLRMFFETRKAGVKAPITLNIFVAPTTEEEMAELQRQSDEKIEAWERWFLNTNLQAPAEPIDASTEQSPLPGSAANPQEPLVQENLSRGTVADLEEQEEEQEEDDDANEGVISDDGDVSDEAKSEPSTPTSNKEVLHLRLRIHSTQSGQSVLRPERLTDPADWKVHYTLTANKKPASAKRQYQMCKRRKLATQERPDESETSGNNPFWRAIRETVAKSIDWRKTMDARDAEDERRRGGVLVWDSDVPVPSPREPQPATE